MREFAFRKAVVSAVCVALSSLFIFLAMTDTADARRRKRGGYAPPYAAFVMDVGSGRVLHNVNADAPRRPASVTKVMTLYLLFEQLERGKMSLDTELPVSEFARRQAPSKIGFDRGETIAVEDAIKALVTKSANDVAVVVAEAIGGDQETFAEMMTEKARSIGMKNTVFMNASGLPHNEQLTTARDLATLGRVIHDRFPKYWRYFQTRNFEFANRNYRNHNRLLGRVDGVDGIKTGFTRASGFNLLTSARDGNRHLVAVVLGGRSGRIRDAQMASLVETHLPRAYAGARQTPRTVEVAQIEPKQIEAKQIEAKQPPVAVPALAAKPQVVAALPEPKQPIAVIAAKPAAAVKPVDYEQARIENIRKAIAQAPQAAQPTRVVASTIIPAKPIASAQTVAVKASAEPAAARIQQAAPVAAFAPAQAKPGAPELRWTTGAQPARKEAKQPADAKQNDGKPNRQAAVTVAEADPVTTASTTPRKDAAKSGFVIQLGASDSEDKARSILDKAREKNRTILASSSAFTESVKKGDATLYRARFGGFEDNSDANAACGALKKSGFNCFVQRI